MKEVIFGAITLITTALFPVSQAGEPLLSPIPLVQETVLAENHLDLGIRNKDPYTNEIFADNILLAVDYLNYGFTLESGEIFAFHEMVLPEFKNEFLKTSGTHYTLKEGYQAVGGLPGNGVCHLATLMNWTATDAGLKVVAKVNHDFVPVPGVPQEYGTSIRYTPDGSFNSANQNLYIINSLSYPVKFSFEVGRSEISLEISKL